MKKITYLLLSLIIILSAMSFGACGEKDSEDTKTETTASSDEASTPSKEKETETITVDTSKITYKVTVVDDAGNAIAGAMVQCCKDACVPGITNDNGVAEFVLEEDDYDVKFITVPEGYEYSSEQEVFNFEEGQTELTITLKKS